MERFLPLTTTTEPALAHRTCEALEDAGIPVMIQHIEIVQGDTSSPGFKLMVPSQFTQLALRLVGKASQN